MNPHSGTVKFTLNNVDAMGLNLLKMGGEKRFCDGLAREPEIRSAYLNEVGR